MPSRPAVALAAAALAVALAGQAGATETPLPVTLQQIDATGWQQITFAELAASGWNQAGTRLSFTLAGEATMWAASQTFGTTTASSTTSLFAGGAVVGAAAAEVLTAPLSGVSFHSHSANTAQQASAQNALTSLGGDYDVYRSSTGRYAFAYEDWTRNSGTDYNDMVVGMSVAAVPEPETYALMLAGLCDVAVAARRRNG